MLEIEDPQTHKKYTIDLKKEIRNIFADVEERWIINCVVPKEIINKIIPVDFLEPVLVDGKAVLSLCAIFMRHAAPDWMPLKLGPESKNCALRIACRDIRDGSPAVWVDYRHSNLFIASLVNLLGFPKINNGLSVVQNDTMLSFVTSDRSLTCHLKKEPTLKPSSLFKKSTDFDEYFSSGIRSYSPNDQRNRIDIIDLHKLNDNKFQQQPYSGYLLTSFGNWFVESVYLTTNGHYQWVFEGSI